jgi:hypothetical protein
LRAKSTEFVFVFCGGYIKSGLHSMMDEVYSGISVYGISTANTCDVMWQFVLQQQQEGAENL